MAEMDNMCSKPKIKRTVQTVIRNKYKSWVLMLRGGISALGKVHLHFCDGSIVEENYCEIYLEQMLLSRRHPLQEFPSIYLFIYLLTQ